ncbi:unnamed protein product [Orchesella dallaii]|uniref:Caspase-8 n=1 Tax=Orchesella dallaii TaxID=48710 RepID=A0ABP1QHP2_9HEXA
MGPKKKPQKTKPKTKVKIKPVKKPPTTSSSMQSPRASGSGNQTVRNGVRTFNSIRRVGWINEPLDVGCLLEKHKETNRVSFTFKSGPTKFNAWSVTGPNAKIDWGSKNFLMIEKGFSYILEGTIRAHTVSKTKYNRSTSTSSALRLHFSGIQVVKKSSESNEELMMSHQITTLQEVKEQIRLSKPFTAEIENVTICYAQFHRYMGCEVCSTAIHYADEGDGKYYCRQCMKKSGPKQRKVCLVLRNMVLKDSEGTAQGGFVCYANGFEKLVKAHEVQRICMSTTDLPAREKSDAFMGLRVNVRIKHQRGTGSKKDSFSNFFKRIAEVISVIDETQRNQEDEDDNENEDTTANSSSEDVQSTRVTSSSYTCKCEEEEVSTDENAMLIDSKRISPSRPSSEIMDKDGNLIASIDTDGQYPMTSTPVGIALIVNMYFNDSNQPRRGSEQDVKALKSEFNRLNITVQFKEDVSSMELQTIIKKFKKSLIDSNSSCCFVVFMSHGILYNVRMADHRRINVFTNIVDHFSENNFKEFQGKPKIFIFQVCSYYHENDLIDCADFVRDPKDIYADMLYISASLPGIKATRNSKKGSYFIQKFVDVLKRFAGNKDLEAILKLTQEEMKDVRFGDDKLKRNIPMYCPILFRNFCFKLAPIMF